MTTPELHPEAREDLIQSCEWYQAQEPHVVLDFKIAIDEALGGIGENPERWPLVDRNHRSLVMTHFPFEIIYRIRESVVEIIAIAIAHAKRRPGYWKKRK